MAALMKPMLYLEKLDGKSYFRVEEDKYLLNNVDTTYTNVTKTSGLNKKGFFLKEEGETYQITNADISNHKTGISVTDTGAVNIYDFTYDNVNSSTIYGSAIHTGLRGAIDDTLTISRVYADGGERPMNATGDSYSTTNRDFLTHDSKSVKYGGDGYVFMRDVTAKNFSDAIIDAKDTVYIMNATFENAFRILRAWSDAHIVIVNSEINLGDGKHLIWLADNSARVSYYNTTWNGKDHPDPDLIQVHRGNKSEALKNNIVELKENPLPDVSDFFATSAETITVEVSVNGDSWREVEVPNTSGDGAPVGDLLFELPELGNGDYKLRTSLEADGRQGEDSNVISYKVDDAGYNYKPSSGQIASNDTVSDDQTTVSDDNTTVKSAVVSIKTVSLSEPVDEGISPQTAPSINHKAVASLGDDVTLVGVGTDGLARALTKSDGGYGIGGNRYNSQLDYDGATGKSEAFLIDFGGAVKDLKLSVQKMTVNEYRDLDETAKWTAYDETGNRIGSGLLSPEDGKYLGRKDGYEFSIKSSQPISALKIEAVGYGDGAGANVQGNNSDFQFKSVDYTRVDRTDDLFLSAVTSPLTPDDIADAVAEASSSDVQFATQGGAIENYQTENQKVNAQLAELYAFSEYYESVTGNEFLPDFKDGDYALA